MKGSIHYGKTDWRQGDETKYPDKHELTILKVMPEQRALVAHENWPNKSRSGALSEVYHLIFSEDWNRIEAGYSIENYPETGDLKGSKIRVKESLFGTGPEQ